VLSRKSSGPATAWIFARALGQVAAGNVQVTEDNVRLEVTLPWLLQKIRRGGAEDHQRARSDPS